MTELLEQVPLDFICLGILGALLLRKLVRMEKYHWPRVVILTGLLWVPAVYLLFLGYAPATDYYYHCMPTDKDSNVYSITEM